ncbi:hypothetical protein GGS21DRAFT_492130 [Xylaria nigripes]|nr:hypothetical protein GGS21DRAFT_492130 [Xylaria nigripes]
MHCKARKLPVSIIIQWESLTNPSTLLESIAISLKFSSVIAAYFGRFVVTKTRNSANLVKTMLQPSQIDAYLGARLSIRLRLCGIDKNGQNPPVYRQSASIPVSNVVDIVESQIAGSLLALPLKTNVSSGKTILLHDAAELYDKQRVWRASVASLMLSRHTTGIRSESGDRPGRLIRPLGRIYHVCDRIIPSSDSATSTL